MQKMSVSKRKFKDALCLRSIEKEEMIFMAITQLIEEREHFEEKNVLERDLILRDCMLGLFLENEVMADRVKELERKIVILQNKCKVSFL